MTGISSMFRRLFVSKNPQKERLAALIESGRFDPRAIKLYRAIHLGEIIGPERLMISPTDHCNIACPICWRHKETPEDLTALLKQKPLPLELIDSIVTDAAALSVKVIDFTGGGEPFTRKDIFRIAAIIKNHGLESSLTSNGTLIDERCAEELIACGLDDICFSIDSLEPEINAAIRGPGVLEKTLRAIRFLIESKQRARSEKPVIRLSSVVTAMNYTRLPEIVEFAKQNSVVAMNFSVLMEWPTNQKFWVADQHAQVMPYLKIAAEQARSAGIYTNADHLITHGIGPHPAPAACYAPWLMAFINAGGTVMLCCTLASQYSNQIGNVYQQRFRDIWCNNGLKQFRSMVLKRKFPKECSLCLPEFMSDFINLDTQLSTILDEMAKS